MSNIEKVNWHADYWFSKHHAENLTDQFKTWWIDFYGGPEQYGQTDDDQQEYWTRCAFAWSVWKGTIK